MFVSGASRQPSRAASVLGAAVILRQPIDEVEGDEAGGGEDAGLVHRAAAEPADVSASGGDRRGVAGEQGAEGRAEALVQAQRDRVDRRGERRERDAERDRGVRQPRAVEVDSRAVRRAAAASASVARRP